MSVKFMLCLLTLTCLDVRSQDDSGLISVSTSASWVVGMPNLLSVSISHDKASKDPLSVPRLDLSSKIQQGIAMVVQLQCRSQPVLQIGYLGLDMPWLELVPALPRYTLSAGETATLFFDINQLHIVAGRTGIQSLEPGEYEVVTLMGAPPSTSPATSVRLRKPTSDEVRFIEAIQTQGVGQRWFPEVVVCDNLAVPDDIPLPAETALLRDFIKLLRLAVRDPAAAAKQIGERKDDWGYLHDTVMELKYECITKTKDDSQAGKTFRQTLEADVGMKGRLTRLEKAGGLLDHFAEIRAADAERK